ncbi:MAG: HAMP domain-containing histidine kinase [Cystobacterineae bacterium]|nr:HAMP domain-containing histidine kinase [Cystobacterineae bacterium]
MEAEAEHVFPPIAKAEEAPPKELNPQNDRLATLGMLSAGLAHEMSNPLAYVLANLRFLSREMVELKTQLDNGTKSTAETPPLLAEWTNVLSESVEGIQQISKLIKEIKGFVRGDASQEQWFELQEVVESSLRILGHKLKHLASVEKHFEGILPCLKGNPVQIQQVFINLLMNAAQAMQGPQGVLGKIEIVLSRKENGISAVVRDNGRGISAEQQEKLFEPFFTTKAAGEGTGLGLFICRQLLAQHGGYLHLESALGQGTLAHVWLPVQSAKKPRQEFEAVGFQG